MAHLDPLSSIVNTLTRDKIIPDVVPESFTPSAIISIVFPNGTEVSLGEQILLEDTYEEPEVAFVPMNIPPEQAYNDKQEGEREVAYTLAMLDPDAPSRAEPIYKSFRHWLVTGLKLPETTSNSATGLIALKTKASVTPYRPPGPRPGSGLHRYIFLLFQEPLGADPFVVPHGAPEYGAALEERRSWNAVEFGEKYGLKLVGATYFLLRATDEEA